MTGAVRQEGAGGGPGQEPSPGGPGHDAPPGAQRREQSPGGPVHEHSPGGTGPEGEAERVARSALTQILEPGDEKGGRWLREFGAQGLLALLMSDACEKGALPGATERRVRGLLTRAAAVLPGQRLAAIRALGGRFVIPGDAEWPSQLDDLGDARPVGLWVRGRPDLRIWALRSVAVVGARACTPYGAHMAAALATGLAERGWVVVSGAAFGVDGAAHRGALAAGGATVAVLACGVDVGYPPGHTALIKRIVQQGLVVGELPPGDHPTRSRFVLRNRVIAALTRGTVVVEAEYRSGSLVTARRAQQLGRFTMGVPGPVTSGLSAGVHELLRGGAVLVTDAAEVVELVGDMGDLAPERTGPVLPRDLLDPRSRRVLEALPARRAVSCAEAARCAGTTEDEALGRLYELHSLGFVERCTEGWRLTSCAISGSNARRGDA